METVPEWEDKLREEATAKERLETAETTLGTLVAKQGRTNQFKTQQERDEHLRHGIESVTVLVAAREKQEERMKRDLMTAKADLTEAAANNSQLRKDMDGRKETLAKLSQDETTLVEKQNLLLEQRK